MKTLAKNTGELNEKVEDLQGKIRGVLHKRSDSEKAEANKGQLRAWAADANRAQAERAARDGQDLEKFPVLEEKTTISTLIDGRAANGTADRVTPSPCTTLAEKPTPPPQFVGYSEALNMNTQAIQVKRRSRATTRDSKVTFSAADDIMSVAEAEELLGSVQGHLVCWPYDW